MIMVTMIVLGGQRVGGNGASHSGGYGLQYIASFHRGSFLQVCDKCYGQAEILAKIEISGWCLPTC
jgi:hypothetical protein